MSNRSAGDACAPTGVQKHGFLERYFPTPHFLFPASAGVDISDSSVKSLTLKPGLIGWEVDVLATEHLQEGVVSEGLVKDVSALGEALKKLSQSGKFTHAHAALPEEAAFVFSMEVPDVRDDAQVRSIIEFGLSDRVPLNPQNAIFDYDVVSSGADGNNAEVGVTVFPKDVVMGYVEAFKKAGITLASLELEARSIARAVLPPDANEVVLLADFGRQRTGIAVIKGQIPIFTHTVGVGGDPMTAIIMKELGMDEVQAQELKNEHGIYRSSDERVAGVMVSTAAALAEEIARHYSYWDTRRNEHGDRVTPVARVILAGGSGNLKGLPEYIAGRIQAPTMRADVWQNVCSFEDYIPPVDKPHSLGYATAIGLALRGI